MSERRKYLVVLVLAVACAVVFAWRLLPLLETAPIDDLETLALPAGLDQAQVAAAQARAVADEFWQGDPAVVRNDVKRRIERLARDSEVELTATGAARLTSVSDHIQAVDVQVAATTEMRAAARFIKAIEDHAPLLEMSELVIERTREEELRLSGTVRAYLLAPATLQRLGEG